MDRLSSRTPSVPTGELIKQALEDARELVRIEVGLAKDEARSEVKAFKQAAIAGAIALLAALLMLSTATMALVLAIAHLGHPAWIALAVAVVYLALAGAMAWVAYRRLPKEVAPAARKQIERDVAQIKDLVRGDGVPALAGSNQKGVPAIAASHQHQGEHA